MNTPLEHDYAPGCDLYDRFLGSALFEPYAIDLASRVADLTEGSVLEMACGTGILTQQLRTRLKPSVALTATDINPGMLDYAWNKLKQLKGINWKQADIANLPFSDASFNVVLCQFGLMFVPDKDRAFQEMRRVLVNGGMLAVSVWDRMEVNPWGVAVHTTIETLFPDNPPQFFNAPFNLAEVDLLQSLLSASGFDKITIQSVSLECRSNSARSLAIGMIQGSPILTEVSARGGSAELIVDAVANAFAHLGGDSPFRTTMQAIVVTAQVTER